MKIQDKEKHKLHKNDFEEIIQNADIINSVIKKAKELELLMHCKSCNGLMLNSAPTRWEFKPAKGKTWRMTTLSEKFCPHCLCVSTPVKKRIKK